MALRLDQKTRLLAALPIFQVMEPEAVHVLAFSVKERKIAAGTHLFRQDEPSDGGYVLVEGAILLRSLGQQKRITPTMLIGEAALISETRRPADAEVTDTATVLVLPRSLVLQVLEAHPASAARLRQHVAEALRQTHQALRQLAL